MNTEQKIHAAYVQAVENNASVCHYTSFEAGYLALLNSLETAGVSRYMPTYRLPEGVIKP